MQILEILDSLDILEILERLEILDSLEILYSLEILVSLENLWITQPSTTFIIFRKTQLFGRFSRYRNVLVLPW